jgi:DNA-binding NarL/FixJ family response regulator
MEMCHGDFLSPLKFNYYPALFDRLSPREREVANCIGSGMTTYDISRTRPFSSVKTVETHRVHIKQKIGFKNNAELIIACALWWQGIEP